MTRQTIHLLIALSLILLSVTPAFAIPGRPFQGTAEAKGLEVVLDLGLARLDVGVGTQQSSVLGPDSAPLETSASGNGVTVALVSGILPDATINLVNAASLRRSGDDEETHDDSAILAAVNSLIVDTGVLSATTHAYLTPSLMGSHGTGSTTGLTVYRDVLGTLPLVQATALTESTSTTLPEDGLISESQSQLEGLALSLGGSLNNVLTLDSLLTSVQTSSDGTEKGASATAEVEFVNLMIAGTDYSLAPPNTVVAIRNVLGQTVAQVTIKPLLQTSATPNLSSAEAVALRIEILAILGLTGTRIDLGQASTQSTAQVSTPPTVVEVASFDAPPNYSLPLTLALGASGLLVLVIVIHRSRRYPA